ncbi:YitT family protein [Bacillus sp. FJAT-47783]|uniref:YczE/YyaS/YitT family protein n=1 Tax=Bacillus sp. FJAT-47783 TaxID=2922712 RepID=UPI001FADDCA5|nr:YitT family protein [Bacillus sp. FJAT-47783]
MKKEWIIRWCFFMTGLMVLGFGIALTIKGKILGIGPWDVFHYGLYLNFGLSIGVWSIIVGFLLLTITSLFTKELPKFGAFLNMLLLGVFIDLFNYLLPQPDAFLGQISAFIFGVIVIGYGIGLYVSANFGAGPRDGIMLLIVEKTGWSVTWVRNGIEIFVLLVGWALGGPIGIGTLLIAFLLGKVIAFSLPQCQKLLMYVTHQLTVLNRNRSIT